MRLAAVLLWAGLALLAAEASSQVVISEIMYNPDGSDTEVGAAQEWVELYNAGRRPVDLSGWTIEGLHDQHASSPLPAGDFNGDSVLDAADYGVWREALSTGSLSADANGDEIVDRADYEIWRANFGRSGAPTAVAVPEGASLTLLAAALATVSRVRRPG